MVRGLPGFARYMFALIVVGLFAILVVGCPVPFDESMLLHVKDQVSPAITVLSPEDGSSYAATVIVTGRASDSSTESADAGQVKSMSYEVVPALIPGDEIAFSEDGSFEFRFHTEDFSGTMVIRIIAEDWNGNLGETSFSLSDDGAVPSFSAWPGNTSVTLDWDPVPLAGSYSVLYTENGTDPNGTFGKLIDDIPPPFTLTDLENGVMYIFQLVCHSVEGPDNWSRSVSAIPLTTRTLAPMLREEYRQISLEWDSIPGADQFQVFRSIGRDGPFEDISGSIGGTQFIDTEVEHNLGYYYRVRPAMDNGILSDANFARPSPFCGKRKEIVGSYYYGDGDACGIAICDFEHVCIVDGATLRIFDVSNAASPVVVFARDIPGAQDVVVAGDYLFVAAGTDGVRTFEISNPSSPAPGFAYDTLGTATAVAVSGVYLYVADGLAGVQIFDLSDPANPNFAGTVNTPGFAQGVAGSGNFAYVADGDAGLSVIYAPTLMYGGGVDTPGTARGIAVYGAVAVLADGTEGLQAIDISNPFSPAIAGAYDSYDAQDVEVMGDYVCIADGSEGIKILNVLGNPTAPELSGWCDTYQAKDLAVSGRYAFVADGEMGFRIIETSLPPDSPEFLGSAYTVDVSYKVVAEKDYAYVADRSGGLAIVDIADPACPIFVSIIPATDVYDVDLSGDLLFVADYGYGLKVMDISDRCSPVQVGECTNVPGVMGLAVRGNYAYVADYDGNHLAVVDISRPDFPFMIGACDIAGCRDVCVSGNYAYVAAGSSGFMVVNIADPTTPVIVSSLSTSSAAGVTISGDYVYVAALDEGIKIVNISDPNSPFETGSIVTNRAYAIDVKGNYAFVADGDGGFTTVEVTDPYDPEIVTSFDTPGIAYGIVVSGKYAFVADGPNGFQVIDLLPE